MKCSGINCPMQYPYDVKKCLCVDTCPYATTVPYTNAERIRAMSDEELATMLFDYKECNKNCIMSSGKHCYEICEEESVILKWLQQPAEEDDDEN